MADLDGWDIGLLALAAFVATTALVRLMLARRDELVHEVEQQIAAAKAKRKKKRKKK